jgi:two-component system invasion response regulator UvrY
MYTVLVVDDDHSFRKVLCDLFDRGSGFDDCVEAGNGAEAIAETKRRSPNLVIVDSAMAAMNGLQLALRLKAIMLDLPIFLFTANYNSRLEKEALSCGVTAVFAKGDDLTTVVANARAVCGLTQKWDFAGAF